MGHGGSVKERRRSAERRQEGRERQNTPKRRTSHWWSLYLHGTEQARGRKGKLFSQLNSDEEKRGNAQCPSCEAENICKSDTGGRSYKRDFRRIIWGNVQKIRKRGPARDVFLKERGNIL